MPTSPEPQNLTEAHRDLAEALDALGRAVIAEREALRVCNGNPNNEYYIPREVAAWEAGQRYFEAHLKVQEFQK